MSDYLDINNEELLKDFFSEAEQQVENLESNILVIENDPSNSEAIDEIFRAAHTLKGGSATVEMHELSGFTHVMEDVLDELRSGSILVTEDVVDALLSSIDIIKVMLAERSKGSVYEENVEPIKERLLAFVSGKQAKSAGKAALSKKSAAKPALGKAAGKKSVSEKSPLKEVPKGADKASGEQQLVETISSPAAHLSEYDLLELKTASPEGEKLWGLTVVFDEANPMNSVGGIQVFAALKNRGSIFKTIPDFDELYKDEFHPQVIYYMSTALTGRELEEAAFVPDVVLAVDAQYLDDEHKFSLDTRSVHVPPPEQNLPVQDTRESVIDFSHTETAEEDTNKKPLSFAVSTKAPVSKKAAAPVASHATTGSILRVDSKRIDDLLNLVSEAVITKATFNQTSIFINNLQNQLQVVGGAYKEQVRQLFEQLPLYLERIQKGESMRDIKSLMIKEFGDLYTKFDGFDADFKMISSKFRAYTQNLGRITGELQEGVMKIRMVPISQIFSRFPRVVRDLSKDLDKKINLVIEGEDTELDKSVIEDLLDPIMHCVRNSLDHGIELPAERRAAGKPEEGTLLLKASNEGNLIVIDIEDDGKGIDVEVIREKAIERGLIHPNKIITDQEAFQFIFAAGFSTAQKITNVSGRGVGLDVVRTQIEKLNGTVLVTSQKGRGSKFSIRLPLTLAIIQGLLVRVGTEVYSIPIASVIESQRIRSEEIKRIDNYEVLNVRNEVISVLRLSRLFGIKTKHEDEYNFIVIVGTADKKIGIMVDSLIGEEDVVIKPLRDQYTNSPGIAGASILGDGSVSLIIDVSQLLELGVKQELSARNIKGSVL